MPELITRTSYLTVNSLALSTPAYWITNLDSEMLRGPTLRNSDTIIPGAIGVYANPRAVTAKLLQLQMVVVGHVDNSGAATSDYREGLTTNVEVLTAGLGLGSSSGDGTVTATWTRWSGPSKSANVHVVSFETSDLLHRHVNAVLELSVPVGAFV